MYAPLSLLSWAESRAAPAPAGPVLEPDVRRNREASGCRAAPLFDLSLLAPFAYKHIACRHCLAEPTSPPHTLHSKYFPVPGASADASGAPLPRVGLIVAVAVVGFLSVLVIAFQWVRERVLRARGVPAYHRSEEWGVLIVPSTDAAPGDPDVAPGTGADMSMRPGAVPSRRRRRRISGQSSAAVADGDVAAMAFGAAGDSGVSKPRSVAGGGGRLAGAGALNGAGDSTADILSLLDRHERMLERIGTHLGLAPSPPSPAAPGGGPAGAGPALAAAAAAREAAPGGSSGRSPLGRESPAGAANTVSSSGKVGELVNDNCGQNGVGRGAGVAGGQHAQLRLGDRRSSAGSTASISGLGTVDVAAGGSPRSCNTKHEPKRQQEGGGAEVPAVAATKEAAPPPRGAADGPQPAWLATHQAPAAG